MAFPFSQKWAIAGPVAAAMIAAPAAAQDQPAVSDFNAKIAPFGGYHDQRDLDGDFFGGAEGSLVAPLGHSFGAQIEGAAGALNGDFLGGGGLHLFWRDPSIALLGVYGVYGTANDVDLAKVGPEAELYYGPILARTWLGYQTGDGESDDGFFGQLSLRYYPDPDIMLKAQYDHGAGVDSGTIGFEWQLPLNFNDTGIAFYADGTLGERKRETVMAGIRIYFGGGVDTLHDRHRLADPPTEVVNTSLDASTNYDDCDPKSVLGPEPAGAAAPGPYYYNSCTGALLPSEEEG